ncbi:amidohydrolase family protein [Terriglobus tenax]|uniref:amidohydrolase family protein n=1 Tax=Terriglobus tenax TaxID=1111115 RepID=UPI0021DFDFE0|nr:amidohydrolase family protein [Terriglobus tenax]
MHSMFRKLTVAAATLALGATAVLAQAPKKVALVGGMLITGREEQPLHHAAVLIEGNRIVAVGPMDQVKIPADATVLDTTNKTMLPGLIDTHVHMVLVGHGDYPRYFKWLDDHKKDYPLSRILDISAKQLILAGVTSGVDLGAPLQEILDVRERIKKGMPGPRLQVSGPWLTRHVAIFPASYQHDVTSPADAAAFVDKLADAGVDVIKAHSGLTREDYFALVQEAHKRGIKVHAHIYDEESVRNAFDAGVDILQHVGSAGLPPYSEQLQNDIARSGRPVVPTVYHRAWLYPETIDFPERLDDPEFKEELGEPLYSEMMDSFKNFPSLAYFQRVDREQFFAQKSLKQWIDGGEVVSMGTDNGTPANFHKDALWREMKVFVDNGMSPMRAIIDATRVNARNVMGMRDLGTVEPGKLADVIAVDGNPLADISVLGRVDVVVKDGVIYKGAPAPAAKKK